MAKHRTKEARQQPTEAPAPAAQMPLTHPLFGITKGEEADRYCAVVVVDGKVESLTPKRGGRDAGERVHFAVARALEAFRASDFQPVRKLKPQGGPEAA